MVTRREKREEVDYTLQVKIERWGHEPIIPHGHAVRCLYDDTSVQLYDELETEIYPFPKDRRVTMKEAGVGLILDHRYHVPHLELMGAELSSEFDYKQRNKLRLTGVYEELWYCIMFVKGHFWARFDWIEELTQPAEVQSARDSLQGSTTGRPSH